MNTSLKHSLTADKDANRIDVWLQKHFPDSSRSMLQRLIREGHVLLKGKTCDPKADVKAGDGIEIEFPPPQSLTLKPESIKLDVLFEDKHLLVLNKAAGMVVHPGAGHSLHTLVHALLHHCRGQLSGIGGMERPGIVHRLDKDTSGCLVVAKTDAAHRKLVESFQSRSVEKVYLALVWGKPRMHSGKIDKPMGRHPVHRNKMAIKEDGRPALTEWKIIKELKDKTLLECRIHTGRTHQIRVHLAFMGCPVVGDLIYGRSKGVESKQLVKRQMLHAWRLSFEHPVKKTLVICEAPIPKDMQKLLKGD